MRSFGRAGGEEVRFAGSFRGKKWVAGAGEGTGVGGGLGKSWFLSVAIRP
jgi:hypothetical protein